jgi:RNA polymerase sigma-70 factor (ECF subfamily)
MASSAAVTLFAREGGSEDAAWVLAARAGDADATLRLLARHRPPLVRLLTGVTGDLATAEDAAQEALLQALRCLGQLREPALFYPWLRRLALRHALRRLRRHRDLPLDAHDAPPDAIDPARLAETRLTVRAVLGALPVELRATLVLREVEQLSYEEIAEAMGVPVGTVRSRLFAARRHFRERWMAMEASDEA